MKTVIRPVKPGEASFHVATLHKALEAMGLPVAEAEIEARKAGTDTRAKVRALQKSLNVPASEGVLLDDATIAAVGAALKERGLTEASRSFTVTGTVRRPNGSPVRRQQLMAFDLDLRGVRIYREATSIAQLDASGGFEFLGTASSDSRGAYQVTFYDWQSGKNERKKADVVVYAVEEEKRGMRIVGRSRMALLEDYGESGLVRGLDVLVAGAPAGTEYDRLIAAVTPFLKESDIALAELSASREQVAFTAAELDLDLGNLQIAAAAHALARERKPALEAELLYGLGRQHLPLAWAALQRRSDEELAAMLLASSKAEIIGALDEKAVAAFLKALRSHAVKEALTDKPAGRGASLDELLAGALPKSSQRAAFLSAISSFQGSDFRAFWEGHLSGQPEFKDDPALVTQLLATERLALLTGHNMALMTELQVNRKLDTVEKLLDLTPGDWLDLVRQTGVPDAPSGMSRDEAERTYAGAMQGMLNAAFPTRRIARMVSAGDIPIDSTGVMRGVTTFLDRNPGFDFAASRVHEFDKAIGAAARDHAPAVKDQLLTMQRVFQVSPSPDAMATLLRLRLTSARSIAAMPRKSFLTTHGPALGGMDVAYAIHQRAEHIMVRTEQAAMQMMDYSHGDTPALVMGRPDYRLAMAALQRQIPNYSELFGRPDICECEHCRSVYSAAAYLVDLLRFLGGSTSNAAGRTPLDMLLTRRPDLVYLPLTCENTNTLIPYVDLSTEIMEYFTVHDALTAFQGYDTGETVAADLRASPQHTDLEAYRKLKDVKYPFTLPYHQPLDAIRVHADHLQVSRFEVLQAMNPAPSPTVANALSAEALRIGQEEYQVLTGRAFNGTAQATPLYEYYGYAAAAGLATLNQVPEFLRRTGVSYRDLVALVETRFINPHQGEFQFLQKFGAHTTLDGPTLFARLLQVEAGVLDPATDPALTAAVTGYNAAEGTSITTGDFAQWITDHLGDVRQVITLFEPQSACDLDTTVLRTIGSIYGVVPGSGITDARWSAMHRFIRLWRKLGWTIHETDVMLAALGESDIVPATISKLDTALRLLAAAKLSPDRLATAWGSIDVAGKGSLYRKLFLSKAVQPADPAFVADAWGDYLQDPNEVLGDHLSAVLAAFRIRDEDLTAILGVARIRDGGNLRAIDPATDSLDLAILSTMYRYVVLAKALKFKVPDFCTLIGLFGASPFSVWDIQLAQWTGVAPQQTYEFYRLAEAVKESGFKTGELQYILQGTMPPDSRTGLDREKTRAAARAIREAFASIEKNHPEIPPSPLAKEVLTAALALTFQPEVVSRLMAVLEGTEAFQQVTDPNLLVTIPDSLAVKYTYVKGSGRLACAGVMTDGERTALKALANVNANFSSAVDLLYAAPESFLGDNFASVFTIPAETRAVLLDHPAQATAATLEERYIFVYRRFIPMLKTKLRRDAIHQHLASLLGLGEESVALLVAQDVDAMMTALSTEGFSATYFADALWNAVALTRTDATVDFAWSLAAPAPAVPADNFSVRWEAYLAAPASAEYTLRVDVAEADEAFKLYLDGALILEKLAANPVTSLEVVTSLNAARLHLVRLDYAETAQEASASLRWMTATAAPEIVPAGAAYPAGIVDAFANLATIYHRAARFILGFALSPTELNHLIERPADFGNIDFKALTQSHWKQISAYTALRRGVPQAQAMLTDVFAAANRVNPLPTVAELKALLASATAWDAASLDFLVDTHFGYGIADFRNHVAPSRLQSVMKIVGRTGLSAETVADWGTATTDFDALHDTAQRLRNAVKAKYEEADWLDLAGHLSDTLRGNQQRALVAYLLTRPAIQAWGARDADGLFEYFLIDVQMEPCMETSRVVQANAAIQMFVQRCLLNLESNTSGGTEQGVSPGALDQARWAWMKNYRVWEANRKVFLYPENWLEPEWRNDRSEFFRELESFLVQNDITPRSVEEGFRNYLSRLDEVAHLEVCGLHRESFDDGTVKFLHVVGRTPNAPYGFFYRRWNQYHKWSPWERLPVDIRSVEEGDDSGVHVIPVVWKNRLFVFWPEFVVVEEPAADNSQSPEQMSNDSMSTMESRTYWEIHLAWSESQDGKWTGKQVSKEFIKQLVGTVTKSPRRLRWVYAIDKDQRLEIAYHCEFEQCWHELGRFQLSDITAKIVAGSSSGVTVAWPGYGVAFETYARSGKLVLADDEYLRRETNHRVLVTPTRDDYAQKLDYPFFFSDSDRSYFVRPADILIIDRVKHPERHKPFILDLVDYERSRKPFEVPTMGPEDYLPEELASYAGTRERGATVARRMARAAPMEAPERMVMARPSAGARSTEFGAGITKVGPAFGGMMTEVPDWWLVPTARLAAGLEFHTFYHPVSSRYVDRLNRLGLPGLMASDTDIASDGGALFENRYIPNFSQGLVQKPADFPTRTYYKENVCFDVYGANSQYNWELFFHAPLYIATRLSKNGKFAEAMAWFHYIFDPTTDVMPGPGESETSRYWKVLPFKTTPAQNIADWFVTLASNTDPNAAAIVAEWRDNPFQPHLVAANRPIAYMKHVVIKYVENLVAWGDSLFRQFTRENVYEAMQLYVIANHILGPRPEFVPKRGETQSESYDSLKDRWDAFSNALVALENVFPYSSAATVAGPSSGTSLLGVGTALYFCIPSNERLIRNWDTVADRLFKIRHCRDIDGIERKLSLFAPEIDPGALIQAMSQGLSLGSILADLNSPAPLYRFSLLLQKANELCADVKALGAALLGALEKKDAEELGRLRATHESGMLELMTALRERQVLEAKANKENLDKSRATAALRFQHYLQLLGNSAPPPPAAPTIAATLTADSALPGDTSIALVKTDVDESLVDSAESGVKLIPKEQEEMTLSEEARSKTEIGSGIDAIGGLMNFIPGFSGNIEPFGIGMSISYGGSNIAGGMGGIARFFHASASDATSRGGMATKMAAYIRREQEWTLQANLAAREIVQLDKQITAAEIRIQSAKKELANHKQQIENAAAVERFLREKFSNQELYQWMKEQLFAVHKQSYNLAYDLARKAEKAYKYETGAELASFIQYGYWDNSRQGLAAGEKLQLALRQMETAYLTENRREFELTKSVSLARLAPLALIELRETGKCFVSVPEELFDLDFRGHYFRRLKSVRVSIPCVVGPHTSVSCTLRLVNNSVRTNTAFNSQGAYEHEHDAGVWIDDDRFRTSYAPVTAIATSSAQNDPGLFDFNFRDERYLPFELAGAISEWQLELSTEAEFRSFDYSAIADVILHFNYTAREGGGQFKDAAAKYLKDFLKNAADLADQPLVQLFSMRRDFPTEWHRFLRPDVAGADQVLKVMLSQERFPFLAGKRVVVPMEIQLFSRSSKTVNYDAILSFMDINDVRVTSDPVSMAPSTEYGGMHHATIGVADANLALDEIDISGEVWLKLKQSTAPGYAALAADPDEVEDLFLVMQYKLDDLP